MNWAEIPVRRAVAQPVVSAKSRKFSLDKGTKKAGEEGFALLRVRFIRMTPLEEKDKATARKYWGTAPATGAAPGRIPGNKGSGVKHFEHLPASQIRETSLTDCFSRYFLQKDTLAHNLLDKEYLPSLMQYHQGGLRSARKPPCCFCGLALLWRRAVRPGGRGREPGDRPGFAHMGRIPEGIKNNGLCLFCA